MYVGVSVIVLPGIMRNVTAQLTDILRMIMTLKFL